MGKKSRIIGIRLTALFEQTASVLRARAVVGDAEAAAQLRVVERLGDLVEQILVETEEARA